MLCPRVPVVMAVVMMTAEEIFRAVASEAVSHLARAQKYSTGRVGDRGHVTAVATICKFCINHG